MTFNALPIYAEMDIRILTFLC